VLALLAFGLASRFIYWRRRRRILA
jgi:hypothetical protein